MSLGIQPRAAGPSKLLFKSALRGGLGMLRLGTRALRGAGPRELGNKLEVFERFQFTLAEIGATGGASLPLAEAVRRAAAKGPFASVWITEGIGHALAETSPRRGLLTSIEAEGIPLEAWIPLHTGMGLSLAGRFLSTADAPDALRRFLGLCMDNSLPGYARAAFEGLGFVACNLHSQRVPEIDRQLTRNAPGLVGYFWHGVGRGLYFSPVHAAPGSTGAALAVAASEPPHEEGRRNAIAGLAWAVTLVNLRHPEVLEDFLVSHAQQAASALANGISSAVAVWCDAAGPGEVHLRAFLDHRPGDPAAGEIWRRLVVEPSRRAMWRQPALRASRRLEELFRCPLNGLNGGLS